MAHRTRKTYGITSRKRNSGHAPKFNGLAKLRANKFRNR